jgi:hypothetical protein
MFNQELIVLAGEVVKESRNAYQFRIAVGDKLIMNWIPKSVCKWDHVMMQMAMPRWCARVKYNILREVV